MIMFGDLVMIVNLAILVNDSGETEVVLILGTGDSEKFCGTGDSDYSGEFADSCEFTDFGKFDDSGEFGNSCEYNNFDDSRENCDSD